VSAGEKEWFLTIFAGDSLVINLVSTGEKEWVLWLSLQGIVLSSIFPTSMLGKLCWNTQDLIRKGMPV